MSRRQIKKDWSYDWNENYYDMIGSNGLLVWRWKFDKITKTWQRRKGVTGYYEKFAPGCSQVVVELKRWLKNG